MHSKNIEKRTLILMLMPCLVVLCAIIIVPLITLFVYSFYDYKLADIHGMEFIGWKNYGKALQDEEFRNSLLVTARYMFGVLISQIPIGLLFVEILSNIKKGAGVIKTLIMPPMVVPGVVAAVVWRLMYDPSTGLINYFLGKFGIQPQAWLANPDTTLVSLLVVDFWQNTPFVILMMLAGRFAISDDLYEAAKIDGANVCQLFRYITLPLVRGTLMICVLFRVIDSLKGFTHISLMTAGGPGNVTTTINYYAYRMAFTYTDIGYSSALGVFMLLITTFLAVVMLKLFHREEEE